MKIGDLRRAVSGGMIVEIMNISWSVISDERVYFRYVGMSAIQSLQTIDFKKKFIEETAEIKR